MPYMNADNFTDGEWYLHIGRGKMLAHFYQRPKCSGVNARTSCGMSHRVEILQPNATAPDKRTECQSCWRSECRKARRG